MGELDTTEKLFEDYNDVFADIVNVLLFDGKEYVTENSLLNTQDKSMYKSDGKIHQQERDVSKFWEKGNMKIAMYGLENQTANDNTMPLRVMAYDGATYKKELLSNEKNCIL